MADDGGRYYCPQCGYDLRGQTINRCPECGFEYDQAALESMGRQGFHGCIGPYLSAISPLVWSATFSLLHLCIKPGLFFPCSAVLILPLVVVLPQTIVNWIQDWMLEEGRGQPRGRRIRWAWPWNAEDLFAAGPFLMSLFVNGLLVCIVWRGAAAVFSGGLLAVGLWRTWAGAEYPHRLAVAFQHLSMPPHRVQALRRTGLTCWVLAGLDAVLWVATIVV